ncbi:HNH endonuclease [Nocardiopsis sp. NPDC049922]|uniref:HNH endonuclease n=1 Tax=Nocardiopsis sp. NPDC049922 TaxID=3155157 RepID=UPI0033DBBA9B
MPRAKTICAQSGCLEVSVREGKCATHARPSWSRISARNLNRPGNWGTLRHQARQRARGTCYRCGASGAKIVDHVTPVSRGGTNQLSNLAVICGPCHAKKTYRERFL